MSARILILSIEVATQKGPLHIAAWLQRSRIRSTIVLHACTSVYASAPTRPWIWYDLRPLWPLSQFWSRPRFLFTTSKFI